MAEATFMPCVPQAKCPLTSPKEAGKEVGILRVLVLTTTRIPRHFVKVNDKGKSVTWPLQRVFIVLRDSLSLWLSLATVPNSKFCLLGNWHFLCCLFPTLPPLALPAAVPFAWPNLGSAGEEIFISARGGLTLTFPVELFVEVPDKPSCPFLQSKIGSSGMKLLSADYSS